MEDWTQGMRNRWFKTTTVIEVEPGKPPVTVTMIPLARQKFDHYAPWMVYYVAGLLTGAWLW